MNPLTRNVGLRVGPIVLDTLVKHYFERFKEGISTGKESAGKDDGKEEETAELVQLRQDELLYDEAFNIIKAFLATAALHTVEEVQNFSNTRTPSPPWVHVIRLLVPMSCCDEAAGHLIRALGGEDVARKVVGGVKWWQVRAVSGVDAEWITAKKDWQEAKKRYKMQQKMRRQKGDQEDDVQDNAEDNEQHYEQDMDKMRCILYLHGGGYYFGSIDQERYSIQRYARKINGRVFAINYRLAPQYPFPCAIQDALAAYLYLIQPPPEAQHQPVKPGHIVVAGDSAGGGLTLALLQVLRDSGLPLPAGGVLISPWCDLTHSFPSIHTNTATDVIPQYGLSLHKPSLLWPPPSHETTARIQSGLRDRIRHTLNKMHEHSSTPKVDSLNRRSLQQASSVINASFAILPSPTESSLPIDIGATTPFPSTNPDAGQLGDDQKVVLTAQNGEILTIEQQVQLYTVNNLVTHPLVSPAMSYLGGLPPLFFIASDKEVLRDEIIYTAHKAAYPEKFPIKDEIRAMYPALTGIENRYGPTPVHLQVYDDTAHVLPVLFAFTTPAKYCFRAIASFCKYTTGMLNASHSTTDSNGSGTSRASTVKGLKSTKSKSSLKNKGSFFASRSPEQKTKDADDNITLSPPQKLGLKRSFSENVRSINPFSGNLGRKGSLSAGKSAPPAQDVIPPLPPMPSSLRQQASEESPEPSTITTNKDDKIPGTTEETSAESGSLISTEPAGDVPSTPKLEVTLPRTASPTQITPPYDRFAGDPIVYSETAEFPSMKSAMIRERVSTRGVIRPLEPEEELDAMKVPQDVIGNLSELAVRRYIEGKNKYDKKFASTIKAIEKQRNKNLERAKKDTIKNMNVLQHSLDREAQQAKQNGNGNGAADGAMSDQRQVKDGLLASSGWIWAWALDENERPPPSSIVSRRDTSEALRLARVADIQDDGGMLSGNNLWGVINNFLTPGSGKEAVKGLNEEKEREEEKDTKPRSPRRSLFPRIVSPGNQQHP